MLIATQSILSWNFMVYPRVIASWKVVIKKLILFWNARFCSRYIREFPAATLSFFDLWLCQWEYGQKKFLNFGSALYLWHTQVSGLFGLLSQCSVLAFVSCRGTFLCWPCSRILFSSYLSLHFQLTTTTRAHPDEIGQPETSLTTTEFGRIHQNINFNHLSLIQAIS